MKAIKQLLEILNAYRYFLLLPIIMGSLLWFIILYVTQHQTKAPFVYALW